MTQRLVLRHLEERDLDDVYAMLSDPRVMRYYPEVRDRDGARRWLDWTLKEYREAGHCLWAVELEEDGTFLGQCGVIRQNVAGRPDLEVGYMFKAQHWGRGYATEAARASKDFAFARYHPDRVVSFIRPANTPSAHVAQRNGMRLLQQLPDSPWGGAIDVWGVYANDYAPGPG